MRVTIQHPPVFVRPINDDFAREAHYIARDRLPVVLRSRAEFDGV